MSHSYRVNPGQAIDLSTFDARETHGLEKEQGEKLLPDLQRELGELQELLYAAADHSLLVVLQGTDTSGKDGTIRSVFDAVNPVGIHAWPFAAPSDEELAHDFLWRVHRRTPRLGMIGIFNRSHYEDVLVVRVRKLAPREVWSKRYDHINAFEQLLADSNTIICKFFLHISKKEQEERLLEREQELEKAWKLAVGDWKDREFWDDYQAAYEDVLSRTSTEHAPWHIVPADRKWYRNIAVTQALVEALRPYRDGWLATLNERANKRLAELQEYRATKGAE